MNEAARKQVARSARNEASLKRGRLAYGATTDELATEAWTDALQCDGLLNTEGARQYFHSVFINEVERDERR